MSVKRQLAVGEYYHVYNRAARKHTVFFERTNYARFLFGLVYFQSPATFVQLDRHVRTFSESTGFDVSDILFESVVGGRHVELVAFCIMPNHYHLIVRQLAEGGIERYMQRVDLAYTRYFNTKYSVRGHVFQGPYQSKHIADNEYITHLSAYIHRNPRELKAWKGKEERYPWSSYQDYVKENRWGGLLAQEIILDQFEGTKQSNYADFIKSSPAKEFDF